MIYPEMTSRTVKFLLSIGRAVQIRHIVPVILFLLVFTSTYGQGVGVGTDSPSAAAILDIHSNDQGVLFPRMSTTDREAIDPLEYGLMVYDTTRRMMYVFDYDPDWDEGIWKPMDAFWNEQSPGRINFDGVTIDAASLGELMKIQSVQRQTALQLQTYGNGFAYPIYGLISFVYNNTLHDKIGGRFDVWSTGDGAGRKTGVKANVTGTFGENIGLHVNAEGDSAINRAAWFENGDVVIENRVLVGADTVSDMAHGSALLELRSDSSGLLLPRMTTTQRNTIPSPAEGLHVYDSDLHKTYFYDGTAWEPVEGTGGGGGGGSSPWNTSANGIYYNAGNVGLGTVASADIRMDINIQDEPFGLNLYSFSNTANSQTGLYSFISSVGTGGKTSILGQAYANTGSTSQVYGVRGEAHQSASNANIYGVYGSVTGTGNGLRWAGYFDGDVNMAKQVRIGGGNVLPHESAILDLTSTDKALLLPRMTSLQRTAISPLTPGLVVYDMDSLEMYVYGGIGGWNPVGGTGGGTSHWSELDGIGVYYDGPVGVGGFPFASRTMTLTADNEDIGLYLYQASGGTGNKHGIDVQLSAGPAGDNFGTRSTVFANTSSSDISYGLYGEVYQSTSSGSAVAVYGRANGTGSGSRWAGFFAGNVRVEDEFFAGSRIKINETNEFFNAYSSSGGTKTISLLPTSANGGRIILRNAAGTNRVDIVGNDDNGFITLFQGGAPMINLYGDSDGDGVILIRDKNINQTILLNGENGRVTSKEIEITGGSDMAEYFSTAETGEVILPGSVVVIDVDHPGSVKLSSTDMDKRVVGVVSGANGIRPGMLMGQKESIAFGDVPVAIAGRVYVKADESAGVIEAGDFLTTSTVSGTAMKVNDWDAARGAILGKALTSRDDDGYVLILVNLQ